MPKQRRVVLTIVILLAATVGARADLLITDAALNSVLRYSDTGAFLNTLVSAGSGGLSNPAGVAISTDGSVFVASRGTNQILRYSGTTGAFLNVFATARGGYFTDLEFFNGTLYAARNDFNGAIDLYDPLTGTVINSFVPTAPPVLNQALYIDIITGGLAISTDTSRFFILNPLTGAQLFTTILDTIKGTTFDAAGNQYLAKSDSQNVMRRPAGGGPFADFLPPFTISGRDITFGADGNLYVLTGNRVARFNGLTGAPLGDLVTAGSGGLTGGQYFLFTQAVPEPGTFGLIGIAGMALLAARRSAKR